MQRTIKFPIITGAWLVAALTSCVMDDPSEIRPGELAAEDDDSASGDEISHDPTELEFEGPPRVAAAPAVSASLRDARLGAAVREGESLREARVVDLPASGVSYLEAVALGPDAARRITLDTDGNAVDRRALEELEVRAHYRRYGKLSAELFERVAADDADVPVRFELVVPMQPLAMPRADDPEDIAAFEDAIVEGRAEHARLVAEHAAPLLRWLQEEGVTDARVTHGLPVVAATVPADLLRRAALHEAPLVRRMDLRQADDAPPPELYGYAGHRSMGNEQLDGGGCGGPCTGFNFFHVGLWERTFTPAAIADANTRYLLSPGDVSYQSAPSSCSADSQCYSLWDGAQAGYRCVSGTCRQEHSSWVAAMLGMSGSYTEDGVLYPTVGTPEISQIHVGNGTNDALGWILDSPVLYVNRSQATLGNQFRDIDHAARYEQAFVTMASGNAGTSGGQSCGGGTGYNFVCVGSYNYGNQFAWWDDTRANYSSWVNPTATGAERPHLLGPGGRANSDGLHVPSILSSSSGMTTQTQGYLASGGPIVGTSFSAPAVLSIAMQAHIYEGLFSSLYFPIVKKAVLMASARDANADGALLSSDGDAAWSGQPDGQDGAGAPDVATLEALLDANNYRYVSLTDAKMHNCGSGCREYTVATIDKPSFRHLRVALAYNACVDNPFGSSELDNDFDLWLERPPACGSSLGSVSTTDEVEMLHDTCDFAGSYTIHVRLKGDALQMCGSELSEPVAVAWSD